MHPPLRLAGFAVGCLEVALCCLRSAARLVLGALGCFQTGTQLLPRRGRVGRCPIGTGQCALRRVAGGTGVGRLHAETLQVLVQPLVSAIHSVSAVFGVAGTPDGRTGSGEYFGRRVGGIKRRGETPTGERLRRSRAVHRGSEGVHEFAGDRRAGRVSGRAGQLLHPLHKGMHQVMTLLRQPAQRLALQPVLRLAQPVTQLYQRAHLIRLLTGEQVGQPRGCRGPAQGTDLTGQLAVAPATGPRSRGVAGRSEFVPG